MADNKYPTPMLDELENGPWPSFITGIKRLRDEHPDERINKLTRGLLGQLEHSYETRKGYWKGGTLSVFGCGGFIIPRFSEVGDAFPESKSQISISSTGTQRLRGKNLGISRLVPWRFYWFPPKNTVAG